MDNPLSRPSVGKDPLLLKCIANGEASAIALAAPAIKYFQFICFRTIIRFIRLIGISANPEKWI